MPTERQLTTLLTSLLTLFGLATVTVLVESDWRHYGDSATYLLLARNLAEGLGYTYLGEPFFLRPPGMSWALSHLLEGPFDPTDAWAPNLLVQISAGLTILFVALAMRRLHGTLRGLAIALLFAVNPLTVQGFNTVLSEFPHMALFYAGAWMLLPVRSRGDGGPSAAGRVPSVVGAVLLGASFWFRTAGLLVLPALVLAALGRSRRPGRAAIPIVLAFAVMLPWMLHARTAAAEAPRPTTQLIALDYPTAMLHVDAKDPDSPRLTVDQWKRRIATNVDDVSASLTAALVGGESAWARLRKIEAERIGQPQQTAGVFQHGVAALVMACLLFAVLGRRSLLDGFAVINVVVVLAWFTFVERTLLPLLPALLSAIVHASDTVGRLVARARPATSQHVVTIGVVGVLLMAAALRLPGSLELPETRQVKSKIERQLARWVVENTAPDDVLLAERASILSLLSGRVAYTWRNLPGPWPTGCPPVDWAFYGPVDKFPSLEAALADAAVEQWRLRVGDGDLTIGIFRLSGD